MGDGCIGNTGERLYICFLLCHSSCESFMCSLVCHYYYLFIFVFIFLSQMKSFHSPFLSVFPSSFSIFLLYSFLFFSFLLSFFLFFLFHVKYTVYVYQFHWQMSVQLLCFTTLNNVLFPSWIIPYPSPCGIQNYVSFHVHCKFWSSGFSEIIFWLWLLQSLRHYVLSLHTTIR